MVITEVGMQNGGKFRCPFRGRRESIPQAGTFESFAFRTPSHEIRRESDSWQLLEALSTRARQSQPWVACFVPIDLVQMSGSTTPMWSPLVARFPARVRTRSGYERIRPGGGSA